MNTLPESETSAIRFDRKQVFGGVFPHSLYGLRSRGRMRRRHFLNSKSFGDSSGCPEYDHSTAQCRCGSASLHALQLGHRDRKAGVYADLGCGDSADAWIAKDAGHYAFGVDLLPPSNGFSKDWYQRKPPLFLTADVCERIPFDNGQVDYASCHAVIDLIPKEERELFYSEVLRILKKHALFSFQIAKLTMGHGFKMAEESARLYKVGLRPLRHSSSMATIYYKP